MTQQKIELYKGGGAMASVKNTLLHHDIALKGAKTLLSTNQPGGFDCPGCAWPDRNHASTFKFCENGVKAVAAEATAHRPRAVCPPHGGRADGAERFLVGRPGAAGPPHGVRSCE